MDVTSLDEFYAGGPTSILNPSPCYGTHWDPSKMSSYILPSVTTNIPLMDPRPCVRVCQKYVFSKWNIVDNIPTPEIILPGGAAGINFPPSGFNVSSESDILRIDEGLTKCAEKRFKPNISESVIPVEPYSSGNYENYTAGSGNICRDIDDKASEAKYNKLFYNFTKAINQ